MSPPPPTFTLMSSAPRQPHSLVYNMHTCVPGLLCYLSSLDTHNSDAKALPLTTPINNASRVYVATCLLLNPEVMSQFYVNNDQALGMTQQIFVWACVLISLPMRVPGYVNIQSLHSAKINSFIGEYV